METIWVPVAVALIAALPLLAGALLTRRTAGRTERTREAELAVSGLVALITELQEERAECRRRLEECLKAQATR